MKKASKLFNGLMSKGKSMFNTKKDAAAGENQTNADNNNDGFDSGEDDDLIEIGKHKGANPGAKSMM